MEIIFNIAICDDSEDFIEKLKSLVSKFLSEKKYKYNVSEFYDGEELVQYCNKNLMDIVLVDIDMPKMNGFDAIIELQKYQPELAVIFVTAHEELACQSFQYRPFSFVSKRNLGMLDDVLYDLVKKLKCRRASNALCPLQVKDRMYNINTKEIIYFKSDKHYISSYDINGKVATYRCGVKETYMQLINAGYVYAHRSYIINCRYIEQFDNQIIMLSSKETIKVTRNLEMLREAQKLYGKFMRDSRW